MSRSVRLLVLVLLVPLSFAGAPAIAASPPSVAASTPAAVTEDPLDAALRASAAPGNDWKPRKARYDVVYQRHVPVRMADGTVLRADIARPADPATGKAVPGRFPVLLTQSPYGRQSAGALGSSAIGISPYFVKRGYIDIAVDVRGTGDSHGRFDLFSPDQVDDGVRLVHWAAGLKGSNGKVGLHGASYLGINQLLVAGEIGPKSPLKAIFPLVASNEIYRDTAFMGGIPNAEFDVIYLGGLLPVVNLLNPVVGLLTNPTGLLDSVQVLLGHVRNTVDYNALFLLKTFLGGPQSYDTAYWRKRSPDRLLGDIVANEIPAYLVGGEYDIFQRGAPLNYAGLQNAWAGRRVHAPMRPGQSVTGRYQLINTPGTHLDAAIDSSAFDQLQLRWFDTWLLGRRSGMARTPTPLHYYDLGTERYRQSTTYPLTGATPTTYYFSGKRSGTAWSKNDGSLTRTRPKAKAAGDRVLWSPVGARICDRSVDQWAMGALSLITGPIADQLPTPVPCLEDDRLGQTGPTALTYTTAPMKRPARLAGPISATIHATASTTETQWVVNLADVAPDGTSRPLTQGALLGSHRALNPDRTWKVQGRTVLPYHRYTKAAQRPVTPGKSTRYDVEVFPTYATIAEGHRIRVTVSTTDFPHLLPTPPQLLTLLGGVYQVQRQAAAASSITVPLIGG